MAPATPTITAPTLPPASAIASPAASRVPRTARARRRASRSAPSPAARPRRRESPRAAAMVITVAPDGERVVHAGESRDDRRRDAAEARARPPRTRPSGPCRAGRPRHRARRLVLSRTDTSRAAVAWNASGGIARHDDDGEKRGEQRVLVRLEDPRERELEGGVEDVREPDGQREQDAERTSVIGRWPRRRRRLRRR